MLALQKSNQVFSTSKNHWANGQYAESHGYISVFPSKNIEIPSKNNSYSNSDSIARINTVVGTLRQ